MPSIGTALPLELDEELLELDELELDEELDDEDELEELLELVSSTCGLSLPPPHAKSAVAETSTPASFIVRMDSDK